MDVLDETLNTLHIHGNLVLREAYAPPWAIAIPAAERLATLLGVDDGRRVVAFHLVELGQCEIRVDGAEPVVLRVGEMAICFGGDPHRLSQGQAPNIQSLEALLSGAPNLRRPEATSGAAGASLLCGVFLLHHSACNPLIEALPPLLTAGLTRLGELHNLGGVARLMADEIDRKALGGAYIVERLLEVLCAEAVRAHVETQPPDRSGWFRAIRDPLVGRAIAELHTHPADAWSVPRLAARVAMSPSRFAARFQAALGDSPMAYLAKWRMNLASRALHDGRESIDRVAARVGYESPAAFSRAFKKHLGVSPAAWRERARSKA